MSATIVHRRETFLSRFHQPRLTRTLVVLALLAGGISGLAIGMQAAPAPDLELMHLLRAMAVLKLVFVAAAAGSIFWRLQAPAGPGWLAGYAATCAAMAAGPSLIWFSSHIILASVLLHAGLGFSMLLLWRDGTTADLLHATVMRRRSTARG